MFEGALYTIAITVISLAVALILGLIAAFGRMSSNKPIYGLASIYVSIVRGTPLLVQLMYVYFALPQLGIRLSPLAAAVIGLSLNEGGYLAEIFRSGIQSINRGQLEAAYSIGMSYRMAMRRIILPQAIRVVLPPIGNSAIILLKNSSLASVIAVSELMHVGDLLSSSTFKNLLIYSMVAIIYWVIHYPIAHAVAYLERKADYHDKNRSH